MVVVLILKNMGVVLILKKAPDDLADQFYSHGSWYKNPEESPFAGNNCYSPKESYIICHYGYPSKKKILPFPLAFLLTQNNTNHDKGGSAPRYFKSDLYSFFNGQHHTVRQPER